MIRLENISKTFYTNNSKVKIFDNINLEISQGEIISFIGPNGCGKTTLLKIIAGLEEYTDGEIKLKDQKDHKHLKTGFIFQQPKDSLFPWKNVQSNIEFALKTRKLNKKEHNITLEKILDLLQLIKHKHKYPYQLSGGLVQLVALGRCLALEPDIFLLDEPFSALDFHTSLQTQRIFLKTLEQRYGSTILITHSIDESILLSDRIILLSNTPTEIIDIIDNPLSRPRNTSQLAGAESQYVKKQIIGQIKGFLL